MYILAGHSQAGYRAGRILQADPLTHNITPPPSQPGVGLLTVRNGQGSGGGWRKGGGGGEKKFLPLVPLYSPGEVYTLTYYYTTVLSRGQGGGTCVVAM